MERNRPFFEKSSILGVGLLGASMALAMKQFGITRTINGWGRTEANLISARERGIIDDFSLDLLTVCMDADLVVLATPVGMFKRIAVQISPHLKKGCIVTDVGSVKGALVSEIEEVLPDTVQYIGSHPIAGGEKAGIWDARPDLFKGALCVITPGKHPDSPALSEVAGLWESMGSRVEFMSPLRHDEVFAAVSHFPHLNAFSLVHTVNDFDPEHLKYAGQGFKDATRIAMSSPEMWRDITISNRENILKIIRIFRERLDTLEGMIVSEDSAGIEDNFRKAGTLRSFLSDERRQAI